MEERIDWARNNLDVDSARELQSRGVNVYFAPSIAATKVVDLEDGRVDWIQPAERRPETGWFADYDSLARYCYERGLPLSEVDGYVSLLPSTTREAGDPLQHDGD